MLIRERASRRCLSVIFAVSQNLSVAQDRHGMSVGAFLERKGTLHCAQLINPQAFCLPHNGRVRELHETPSAMDFLRNYVAKNCPVIIRGGAAHWPALKLWTDNYIK